MKTDQCLNCGERLVWKYGRWLHRVDGVTYGPCHEKPSAGFYSTRGRPMIVREPMFAGHVENPPSATHVDVVFVDRNRDEWLAELRLGSLNPPDRAALCPGALIDWTPPDPPMVRLAPRTTMADPDDIEQIGPNKQAIRLSSTLRIMQRLGIPRGTDHEEPLALGAPPLHKVTDEEIAEAERQERDDVGYAALEGDDG